MIKVIWTILFLICALNLQGQKLIDVIANFDINEHQNFILANVNGMSFFVFGRGEKKGLSLGFRAPPPPPPRACARRARARTAPPRAVKQGLFNY